MISPSSVNVFICLCFSFSSICLASVCYVFFKLFLSCWIKTQQHYKGAVTHTVAWWNPVISIAICTLCSFTWGFCSCSNSPHYLFGFLVWKWLPCEWCLMHCYTIDNGPFPCAISLKWPDPKWILKWSTWLVLLYFKSSETTIALWDKYN